MEKRAQELIQQGDHLFAARQPLMGLWQETADNFYPENAEYTRSRNLGEDFAANLDTSYPILVRRDLGDQFSAMLRPTSTEWFDIQLEEGQDDLDQAGREWLQWVTRVQRRAMYAQGAQFTKATKSGDHDFAAIGQCVISTELSPSRTSLLYRNWLLRDVVWCEGVTGDIDTIHRKWKPTARDLTRQFKGKVSQNVQRLANEDPYTTVEVRHCVVPADYYEVPGRRPMQPPYVSVYIEVDGGTILEETPSWSRIYTIPRWRPYPCSQYGYSPATTAALADARLIQAITRTLLEAGEKAVNPPMIGVADAIKSDLEIFPGGFTTVDAKYDERLGEVLRPLTIDKSGIPFGFDMIADIRAQLASAFYLDKLSLPPFNTKEMTAYEVSQRVSEFIRQTMPLFEPLEAEYNAPLCDDSFDILLRNGGFGSMSNLPQSLRGRRTKFTFTSPLSEAIERQKGQKFSEMVHTTATAAQIDPGLIVNINAQKALRDSLNAIGVPAGWIREEDEVAQIQAQAAQQAEAQRMLQEAGGAAAVAQQVGAAGQSLQAAGMV